MPLDREAIEKRDFPVGRRGYDPAAVQAHLARLADQVEALQRAASAVPSASGSVAEVAAERVRGIVEAAEGDAERIRADAERAAGEHVRRVGDAAAGLLERVIAAQRELDELRAGVERAHASVRALEAEAGALASTTRAAQAPAATGAAPAPAPPADARTIDTPTSDTPTSDAPPTAAPSDADVAGARLTALSMALDGRPREETDRYLAQHFRVADRGALLDEVYAAVDAPS